MSGVHRRMQGRWILLGMLLLLPLYVVCGSDVCAHADILCGCDVVDCGEGGDGDGEAPCTGAAEVAAQCIVDDEATVCQYFADPAECGPPTEDFVDCLVDCLSPGVRARATLVSPFFLIGSPLRRFGVECAIEIDDPATLARPVDCTVSRTQTMPHTATDAEGLFVRARLLSMGSGAGDIPAATVGAACDGLAPISIPLNGPRFTLLPIDGTAAGSCDFDIDMTVSTLAGGQSLYRTTVVVRPPKLACLTHEECRTANPALGLCSLAGCQTGTDGDPCVHDSQCDDAQGFLCGSDGLCTDGALGKGCQEDFDCADGLACVTSLCREAALCNPVAQTGCSAGEKCTWAVGHPDTGDRTRCVPDGSVELGQACSFGPPGPSGSFDDCRAGLFCKNDQCAELCTRSFASCSIGFCNAEFLTFHDVRGDEIGTCPIP